MKRTILFTLAISLLPVAAQSQAADVEGIKANIEQMWKDMAQGKADPNKFDQNHNLTAYSSGGLWEDQTANELATTLVGGGATLSVKPHHVKVTLLGEKKCGPCHVLSVRQDSERRHGSGVKLPNQNFSGPRKTERQMDLCGSSCEPTFWWLGREL